MNTATSDVSMPSREKKYFDGCLRLMRQKLASYEDTEASMQLAHELNRSRTLKDLERAITTYRESMPSKDQRECERVTVNALQRIQVPYGRTPRLRSSEG